jgi:threonine dehydrogenase-like Zn-dependent dehydrogenase
VEFAVLCEPLSVVEKAVALALRLHQREPRTALVIGAGSIGLLAAMVLRLRGLDVEVSSVEHMRSVRARLVAAAGAAYTNKSVRKADVVIEAAGSPDAAMKGVAALAPSGVMIVLGASRTAGELPLLDLIVGNRIIAGSVNADPEAFRRAAADLPLMPAAVLRGMIERCEFGDYARSITGSRPTAPKIVHVVS